MDKHFVQYPVVCFHAFFIGTNGFSVTLQYLLWHTKNCEIMEINNEILFLVAKKWAFILYKSCLYFWIIFTWWCKFSSLFRQFIASWIDRHFIFWKLNKIYILNLIYGKKKIKRRFETWIVQVFVSFFIARIESCIGLSHNFKVCFW